MVTRPHLHNRPPLNRYSLTVSQSSALLSVHEQQGKRILFSGTFSVLAPFFYSSKRCRAEYRLPPHSKMAGAASRSPPSRRQLFSLSEPPQSGVARNTACHRTPKWLARRPEALRPGGSSSFPSPNLLKAVSRGIPLATALQNGWRGVPKPSVPASPRMQTPHNGVESQKWQTGSK